ncbi:putative proline-rich transmembrane protein 4 [Penaeus vannamei]|uniref:Putative proline-rich transmembrane protein 4 n=1 Tax=Penaeus vannamei TaxID=6689 RepID=A0A3R7Q9C2_PENVA|nr:putative proline-rich transmembrane protein 4 [Penaeus vannamei]
MSSFPHTRSRFCWAAMLTVSCCLVSGVSGQFSLVSSALSPLRPRASMLTSTSVLGKLGDRPLLPRRSASTRESEIAAIFRGVAVEAERRKSEDGSLEFVPTQGSTRASATAAPGNAAARDSETVSYVLHEDTAFGNGGSLEETVEDTFVLTREEEAVLPTGAQGPSGKSTVMMYPMSGVRWSLGAAWWVHVYVSAGIFALVAAASLCCLARLSAATHLLPRSHYLVIHTLVFLAAILRCLHLFHDPYGIEQRLPEAVSAAVEEASWPSLTGALAILVLALFRSGSAFPLRVVARAVTATWGGAVGAGGLWAVWRVECTTGRRNGQLLGRFNRAPQEGAAASGHARPVLNRAALLTLAASFAQIMLAVLHLYVMLAPLSPTNHVWAWWGRVSLARGFELVVGVAVVAATIFLTYGRQSHPNQDNTIFSVLTSCGREGKSLKGGRNANVFPAQTEKRQILGSFTLHPGKAVMDDTLSIKRVPLEWTCTTPRGPPPATAVNNKASAVDSVTSDFQLLWNRDRSQSSASFRPSSMLVNDSGFVRFRTQVDPEQAMDDVYNQSSLNVHRLTSPPSYSTMHAYNTQTLPNSRYYCTPTVTMSSPEHGPSMHAMRAQTVRAPKAKRAHLLRGRAKTPEFPKGPRTPVSSASRYDVRGMEEFEVASYYNNSIVSSGSNMYSTPHAVSPRDQLLRVSSRRDQLAGVHAGHHHLYEDARECKPPAADALSGVMEPSTCSSLSEIHVDYLTDVSSSNDGTEEEADREAKNKSLDLLKLSTTSLNDVLKGQARAGLLSKLVGSSMSVSCYGYSPLDVEDTSSPSQEDPSAPVRVRRVASSSDVGEPGEGPRAISTLPACRPPNTVTSL